MGGVTTMTNDAEEASPPNGPWGFTPSAVA